MEQMKLFRTAGVNPLGGCIPALLQIPIFFALYSFFNSEIALRGQSFWWANDLSSFDHIIHLGIHHSVYRQSPEFIYHTGCGHQPGHLLVQHEHDAGPEQPGIEIHAIYFPGYAVGYFQ